MKVNFLCVICLLNFLCELRDREDLEESRTGDSVEQIFRFDNENVRHLGSMK